MQDYITTSIFDIFKAGPGPSSSHTIGPMRAALAFREALQALPNSGDLQGSAVDVYLYGSLSLTGEGHGTYRAVLGGLLGWAPETCDCDRLLTLLDRPDRRYDLQFAGGTIPFTAANIHFEGIDEALPYSNTLRFTLTGQGKTLLEKEYYSIGGGFIRCKGEAEPVRPAPPHQYRNMQELRGILQQTGLPLRDVLLQNEAALTGKATTDILAGIDRLIGTVCQAIENGLRADGVLPGPIGTK